ncbi:STAS domain-containing protein [Streptomyces sp. NPDC015139]|uniref:STAS domain-containing protein n=1 Tax=Streptomyces sp. NPDC015139 TaxID=3364942 RepID=UPI0036F735A3
MSGGGGITSLVLLEGDAVLLGVFGELDIFTGPELCAVVTGCLASRPTRLVMDVSGVSFCDASGLAALLQARQGVVQAGTGFVLAGVPPVLQRILAITDLDAGFGLGAQSGPASGTGPSTA